VGNKDFFREVERPELMADHLPQFSADVKNGWSCTFPTLRMLSWRTLKQLFPTDVHAAVNVGKQIAIGSIDWFTH
jgi:hypothetical protein